MDPFDSEAELDSELKELAGDTAPKKSAGVTKIPGGDKKKTPAPRRTSIEKRISSDLAGVELLFRGFGDEVCGDAVMAGTESFAQAVQNLADQNLKARKAIERMLEGGAWGQVIFSGMAMVLPIVMHHIPIGGGEKVGGIFGRFARGGETDGPRAGEDNGHSTVESEFPYSDTSPSVG
jgi:hypothetical protein